MMTLALGGPIQRSKPEETIHYLAMIRLMKAEMTRLEISAMIQMILMIHSLTLGTTRWMMQQMGLMTVLMSPIQAHHRHQLMLRWGP